MDLLAWLVLGLLAGLLGSFFVSRKNSGAIILVLTLAIAGTLVGGLSYTVGFIGGASLASLGRISAKRSGRRKSSRGLGRPYRRTRSRRNRTQLPGELWVSRIAEQFYCEYKVHLRRCHPEVQILHDRLMQGEKAHDALLWQGQAHAGDAFNESTGLGKEASDDSNSDRISWSVSGAQVRPEQTLVANLEGFRIVGRLDLLYLYDEKAILILDLKHTDSKEPSLDARVQVLLYGLLVEQHFVTDELCLGIVLVRRNVGLTKLLLCREQFLEEISVRCLQAREHMIRFKRKKTRVVSDDWRAFFYRYDPDEARKHLDWALRYWRGGRAPIPAKKCPNKCVTCPWNAARLCRHALKPPDPRFLVKKDNGRIVIDYRNFS